MTEDEAAKTKGTIRNELWGLPGKATKDVKLVCYSSPVGIVGRGSLGRSPIIEGPLRVCCKVDWYI